jgi:hypothetical protein
MLGSITTFNDKSVILNTFDNQLFYDHKLFKNVLEKLNYTKDVLRTTSALGYPLSTLNLTLF